MQVYIGQPLTDLDTCRPSVRVGIAARAFKAHVVLDDVLDDKRLLQDRAVEDLGLDRELDLEPLGVRLRPYEAGVHQLNLCV